MITKEDIAPLFKKRDRDVNKGDFGYIGIMGGCPDYTGAVKLANMAQSALRAGCGVSRLIVPESIRDAVTPFILESTVKTVKCDDRGFMEMSSDEGRAAVVDALKGLKALALGMGWGRSDGYPAILEYILSEMNINLVIDADGLNTLAGGLNTFADGNVCAGGYNICKGGYLGLLDGTKCNVVLTPHLKEFSRLTGLSVDEIKKDREGIAAEFASKHKVILLLKGAETIISDGKQTLIVDRGCPGMATAGSGDVLSGILAGLLGYLPADVMTVAAGAYINGRAGELASEKYGEVSMLAGDTAGQIAEAVKEITGK